MFLQLSEEEKTAVTAMEVIRQSQRSLIDSGYNRSDAAVVEERQKQLEKLKAEAVLIENTPEYQRALFKKELSVKLGDTAAPFTDPQVVFPILEEVAAEVLYGEAASRSGALIKAFVMRMYEAFGDEDILNARAKNTFVRYRTLIDAGLPEPLAAQILVAEAGKPWPSISIPTAKK